MALNSDKFGHVWPPIVLFLGNAGVSENESLIPEKSIEISLPDKVPPGLAWQNTNSASRYLFVVARSSGMLSDESV